MKHTRRWTLCCLCLVLCVATSLAQSEAGYPPQPDLPDFLTLPKAPGLRIIDGDTVEISLNKETVKCRLIGVNTPETKHPSKPVEAYGKEASEFTANLLKGEMVWVAALV